MLTIGALWYELTIQLREGEILNLMFSGVWHLLGKTWDYSFACLVCVCLSVIVLRVLCERFTVCFMCVFTLKVVKNVL